jgi:hypothetical protein
MPKAKPDKVVVHRIELQKTEREILEAAAMAAGVGNLAKGAGALLTGAGALIAPLGGALTAIIAAYVAKEGIEDILDWGLDKIGEKDRVIDDEYVAYLNTRQAAIDATLPDGTLLNPGPHDPPMTRSDYELIHGRANMTNIEKLTYDVTGSLPGGGVRSQSELDRKKNAACKTMSTMFGRQYAETAGVCPIGGGNW